MITKLKTICIQTLLATNSGVNDSTETELQVIFQSTSYKIGP